MEPKLTLYDLAGVHENKPFSPATWVARLALNYKGLPFKTVWLHLVDIKPTLTSLGAPLTELIFEPGGFYTVPVLVDASDPGRPVVVADSARIAKYLEEEYPERPIFPEGTKALLAGFAKHKKQLFLHFIPILLVATLPHLADCDWEYFRETRERWFGTKLEDMCPPGPKREAAWEAVGKELDELVKLFNMNGEGKELALGDQVSVVDLQIIALFVWLKAADPDGWVRVMSWNEGRWERLWKRSEGWRLNQA